MVLWIPNGSTKNHQFTIRWFIYDFRKKNKEKMRWIFENVFVWLICCWKCSMCFMFEYHCLLSTDDMVFWKSPLSGSYNAEKHLLNITPRFFKVTSFGPIAVTFSGLSDLHLGNQRVTLKKLFIAAQSLFIMFLEKIAIPTAPMDHH